MKRAPQPAQPAQPLLLLVLLALGGVLGGDAPRAVSLGDVTGTGFTEVGYNAPSATHHQPGVVSLEDVTGIKRPGGDSLEDVSGPLPYHPLPPRPRQPGVVSLEDVTGIKRPGVVSLEDVTGVPRPRPHPYRQPPHRDQYNPYQPPCWAPGAPLYEPTPYVDTPAGVAYAAYRTTQTAAPSVNAVALDNAKPPLLSRARRSPAPAPGVVPLSDVAGPVAAHYPSFGPPAYVRPGYGYGYGGYGGYGHGYGGYYRPRPYYVNVVPCIGLFCL